MIPLFISYYTPEYRDEAKQLVETLNDFELEHRVVAVESRGSWAANCAIKPEFIRTILHSLPLPRGIVFVDADARIRAEPTLLTDATIDADFACWRINDVFTGSTAKLRPWPPEYGNDALASGTVYFANTQPAMALLDRWIVECKLHPERWDQQSMQAAWWQIEGLRTYWLPQAYCKVFNHPWRNGATGPVVIEHMQASRKLKRRIR